MVGSEVNIVNKNPNSVAGATLVDKAGRSATTCSGTRTPLPLHHGDLIPRSGQVGTDLHAVPRPPQSTTEVDFTLPTFATTSLKISG